MSKQDIGIIGLAVMGKNLALNIESKGFSVSVYNRTAEKTREMLAESAGKRIYGAFSLEEFVNSLEKPRKIIIVVKAGKPVDDMIENLKPYISKGDIIIDAGNSYFEDTMRRSRQLEAEGYRFIGTGVSGGEEGALLGPAIMPGGEKEVYEAVEPIFTAISAKVNGDPCCTYIGTDGAGHYVKMVHNGIEYGDMQLICEAYSLLKNILGMDTGELHEVFAEWNKGELNSYLIEITSEIFAKTDPETGKPMVDVILDKAGQKGTGKWTSKSALDLGVAIPVITEAVFARCLSAIKDERARAAKILKGPDSARFEGDRDDFVESVRRALYASKICSYAQGFALLKSAAAEYGWNLDYGRIAMIFRGGCIIRAQFLHKIKEAFDRDPGLANLLLDPYFKDIIERYQESWRHVVSAAIRHGIPAPAFSAALAYYDGYRSEVLPANLLQAQRDYFGAHLYERVDRPRGEYFHTNWTEHSGSTPSSAYTV
ncbi:MAG: decarboxylating NADP(+)-dependent phosphogluconate dehydrogenase [Bacillota bacterium]